MEEFACAFCKVVAKTRSRCPVCGGQGSVRVSAPAMACAYCRGLGEAPARSNLTCLVCGGKGKVTVAEPIAPCPSCRGTGAAGEGKLPCLQCRGKGVVAVPGVRGGGSETAGRSGELFPFSLERVLLRPQGLAAQEESDWRLHALSREKNKLSSGRRAGIRVGSFAARLIQMERAGRQGQILDRRVLALEERAKRWVEEKAKR